MFTLGNGVGGGIILNGKVFEGGMIGGSELGHMVVKADGLQCSCGRKGCLEAYASIPALLSQAKEATGLELSVNEIFDRYDKGDRIITEVLNNYMDILGTGVVNVVNIFRPQLVLLGGSLSHHEAVMLDTIRDKMARECFGSPYIAIPQIAIAQLGSDAGIIGAANL